MQIKTKKTPGFWQLSPFFVFIGIFCTLHIVYYQLDARLKSGFALFACIAALFYAMATFTKQHSLNEKIDLFIAGTAQPTIMYMVHIFIFSSIFTHSVKKMGGIDAAINIGLSIIPKSVILPGLFTSISLFALTIGSSMGSISAFMPIALGFGHKLNFNPAMIAGLVVGASMLGDNLSMISDTTIAAAQITGCSMIDKFKANALLVLPAFLITASAFLIINWMHPITSNTVVSSYCIDSFVKIIPYILVFMLALLGIDVLAVLAIGALSAAGIGIFYGSFSFVQATSFLFDGFYGQPGMVNVLMLVMLIAGLANIIEYNGGIKYLLTIWQSTIRSKKNAELSIATLVFLINAMVAINTIAILLTGPIAKQIGKHFAIPAKRIASLLDIFACSSQGLLPYTPQLLLASAMADVSSITLIPYLYYQFAITIVTLVCIVLVPAAQTD